MSRMHDTGAYDYSVQVLECPQCKAPVRAPLEGGSVTCEYCDSELRVQLRRGSDQEFSREMDNDEDRMTWLKRTLADPNHHNPFDTDANYLPELLHWKGKTWSLAQTLEELVPPLRKLWDKALQEHEKSPEDDQLRFRLYWIADRLALFWEVFATGELPAVSSAEASMRRRAVLETALGKLWNTRFAYVLRCKLSRAASRMGDLRSAKEWLSGCDPNVGSADLDSEYRLALSTLRIAQDEPARALEVLGSSLGAIPFSGKRNGTKAAALRIHTLELLGQDQLIDQAFSDAAMSYGVSDILNEMRIHQAAPKFLSRKGKFSKLGCALVLLVILLIIGIIVFATIVSFKEEVAGSMSSHGGAAGTWSVTFDECVSSSTYAAQAPGARLYSTAYPGYGVQISKKESSSYALVTGSGYTIGPNGQKVPYKRPWDLVSHNGKEWSISVLTPTHTIPVDPFSCTRFMGDVGWDGTEVNDVDGVEGNLDMECPTGDGGRIIVTATFESCR